MNQRGEPIRDPAPLGLIGLGLLGSALASRLLQAGRNVVGFDIAHERRTEFESQGGIAATSAGDLAGRCPTLLLSLPTSEVVSKVIGEIAPRLQPAALVIDTTTGDPHEMEGFASRLDGAGVEYVDASVAGSSEQVRQGQAVLLAGGSPAAFERALPILTLLGRRVFHVGPNGSGARMKLVVNLVLGLNRAVLAEGLGLARALGFDPAAALDVLRDGPAFSQVMNAKGRKMVEGEFTPQARLAQHLKDVRLILAAGESNGARLPFSGLHAALLEELAAKGYGEWDNSAVIKAFEP
jgi:2-hydroxy-3-oxopropionate reductase